MFNTDKLLFETMRKNVFMLLITHNLTYQISNFYVTISIYDVAYCGSIVYMVLHKSVAVSCNELNRCTVQPSWQ